MSLKYIAKRDARDILSVEMNKEISPQLFDYYINKLGLISEVRKVNNKIEISEELIDRIKTNIHLNKKKKEL